MGLDLDHVMNLCQNNEDAHWFRSYVGRLDFNWVVTQSGFAAYTIGPNHISLTVGPKYFEEPGGPFTGAKNLRNIPVEKRVDLVYLYVTPRMRGKEVGRSIIDRIIAEENPTVITANHTPRASWHSYRYLGFRVVGSSHAIVGPSLQTGDLVLDQVRFVNDKTVALNPKKHPVRRTQLIKATM